MQKFGLEKRHLEFVKHILTKYVHDGSAKFYIFGSRAKGNYRKYSDIDIAIESNNFTDEIKSKLEFEFENSTLPYEVDVINLNSITEKFKSLIKDDLIELV